MHNNFSFNTFENSFSFFLISRITVEIILRFLYFTAQCMTRVLSKLVFFHWICISCRLQIWYISYAGACILDARSPKLKTSFFGVSRDAFNRFYFFILIFKGTTNLFSLQCWNSITIELKGSKHLIVPFTIQNNGSIRLFPYLTKGRQNVFESFYWMNVFTLEP